MKNKNKKMKKSQLTSMSLRKKTGQGKSSILSFTCLWISEVEDLAGVSIITAELEVTMSLSTIRTVISNQQSARVAVAIENARLVEAGVVEKPKEEKSMVPITWSGLYHFRWSSTEEETEESESEYQSESSEDEKASRRVGKKPTKASVSKQPTRKWGPKVSSNDEQEDDSEVEMDEERSSASGPTTKSGRPLRKAATEMKKKMEELEKQGEEVDQEVLEEEDEQNEKPLSNAADISKIVGKPRRPTKDDEDEFKV